MASPSSLRSPAALREAYLAQQSREARRALRLVRAAVVKAVPSAVEHFSYGVPGFRLDDRPLVWYAGFKRHFSLYPIGAAIRRAHAAVLEGYETATGTVRFPIGQPVPVSLVTALVKARATEARAEAAGRRAKTSRKVRTTTGLGRKKR